MLRIGFSGLRKAAVVAAAFGVLALLVVAATTMNEATGKVPPPPDKAKKGPLGKASTHKPAPTITPKVLPGQLDFDWNPINFDNGVTVGGNMHLTLRQDGSYTFKGHFHNSGILSYDTSLGYVVKDDKNRMYTFAHTGHEQGIGIGSRDDDWTVNGNNADIARNWASIVNSSGYGAARSDFNLSGLGDALKVVIGTAAEIVLVAGPLLLLAA